MNWDQYWKEVHIPAALPWKDRPHGCIQWKGTSACIDLHCECGAHGHIDAEFFYHYECMGCGRRYAVDSYVKLIELTGEQAKFVSDGGACDFISDLNTAHSRDEKS